MPGLPGAVQGMCHLVLRVCAEGETLHQCHAALT